MAVYCFRHGNKVVERSFPISERPKFITIGGVRYYRSIGDEGPGVPATAGWPLECVASGVAPSQAGELRKFYSDHGCPTEVTRDGNPVYRDAAHRRRALKLRGFHDRAAFY
ncbi:MAG: hypothetical protein IJG13_04605 [Kiritimatiellae bacterium]|nr:hypothetical protein [Kiritimatiellia bacterium]MBQ6327818.1 hypothetical protein [Kiritimatiellia bacterium]